MSSLDKLRKLCVSGAKEDDYQSNTQILALPRILLAYIFVHLDTDDKKRVALVCSWFKEAVYTASLWTGVVPVLCRPSYRVDTYHSMEHRGMTSIGVVNTQVLLDVYEVFRKVKHINLTHMTSSDYRLLLRDSSTTSVPAVTSLKLGGRNNSPEIEVMTYFSTKFPNLTHLDMLKSGWVDNCTLSKIAANFRFLTHLNIGDCIGFNDHGIYLLTMDAKNLISLNVTRCPLTNESVRYIRDNLPHIEHLNLKGITGLTDNLTSVLYSWTDCSIKCLDLSSTKLTSEILHPLSYFSELKVLNLKNLNITDDGMYSLCFVETLTILILFDCDIETIGVSCLARLTGLKELVLLQRAAFSNFDFCHLSKLINLTFFQIGNCNNVTGMGMGMLLQEESKLERLFIVSLEMTNLIFWFLGNLKYLHTLTLSCCTEVTGKGLALLGKYTNVQVLTLFYCGGVDDDAVAQLPTWPRLFEVNIRRCEVSGNAITKLVKHGLTVIYEPIPFPGLSVSNIISVNVVN